MAGELPTFAGFRALSHLDLQHIALTRYSVVTPAAGRPA
jgi:hypothetical protein